MKALISRVPGVTHAAHLLRLLRNQIWFRRDLVRFRSLLAASHDPRRFSVRTADLYPCLSDRTATTAFEPHYTYHTAWAARVLAETKPAKHIDISSSLFFAGIVSAFVPIDFYDFRPAPLQLSGLATKSGDLMRLPFADQSVESLSCMHVVEHVGLGRYGDPLDPDGDLKAMAELQRVVAPGGDFLFVAPVGRPRICFNAHRIYAYRHVLVGFKALQLHRSALIPDDAEKVGMIDDPTEDQIDAQSWGCGCFWFKRSQR